MLTDQHQVFIVLHRPLCNWLCDEKRWSVKSSYFIMSLYNVKCLLCDKKRQDEETFSEIDPLRQFFCAFFLNSNMLLAKKNHYAFCFDWASLLSVRFLWFYSKKYINNLCILRCFEYFLYCLIIIVLLRCWLESE